MAEFPRLQERYNTGKLRLTTLIKLRWLAVIGQSLAIAIVNIGLGFPLDVSLCLALIACSAWLNLFLALRFPANFRLEALPAFGLLTFDALQLAGLLALTGGLTNPFSILLIIPVIISATSLPLRFTTALGVVVVTAATVLAFLYLPLPWRPGAQLALPMIYVGGVWVAVVAAIAFAGVYAWRVAEEARQLADALAATELVLQRELHLSALDGLAAAAAHELGTPLATITLVAREMEKQLGTDKRFAEDVSLLRTQSERCREILKRLTTLSSEDADMISRQAISALIEEATAPHRDFGVNIRLEKSYLVGAEPVMRRDPGVIYGLGNIVENAVDFARSEVVVTTGWSTEEVRIIVEDDGPGISADMLDRIGEPYATTRAGRTDGGGGLGLGVFIARTLLERAGAVVTFSNARDAGRGAVVTVVWPRSAFDRPAKDAAGRRPLDKNAISAM